MSGAARSWPAWRSAGPGRKIPDLSMALEGRFTGHHAMMCRLHLDRIRGSNAAVRDLDDRIAAAASAWQEAIELLETILGFGGITARNWIAEIGPAPHEWFASAAKLASWAGLAPGNYVGAGKRRYGRTGDAGTYIKPALVERPGPRSGTRTGSRPATTPWSAGWAGRRTRPPARRPSSRSRTPCSRSPGPS
ncbi:MAG TPA: transposase [Streptosporangiaceae bacterium]